METTVQRPPASTAAPVPATHAAGPPVDPSWPPPDPAPPPAPAPPSTLAPPLELSSPPASGGGSRLRRLGVVVAALVTIGGSLAVDREPLFVLAAVFILVVPFERLFPRHRQRVRRPQIGTDVGYALAAPLLNAVGLTAAVVVAAVSLAWLPGLVLRPLVALIPGPAIPIVAAVLFDLALYWTHRWYHEVPYLWRFHAIHHSTRHLDWVSGFRAHPLDGTLIAPAFVFLVAAGFTPELTGVLAAVQIVTGIFLHANVRWRLRWLHRIVATPEFHHWHHANEPGAINANYSGLLPAWDQLFGTYFMPADRRPSRYGVSEHIPDGMILQLWYPLRGMGNPLRFLLHPVRSVRALVGLVPTVVADLRRSATRPRNAAS